MATPAKAFIDPVWPSSSGRMIPSSLQTSTTTIPVDWASFGFRVTMIPAPEKKFTVLIAMSGNRAKFELPLTVNRIPTPPIGRMQINTFPPIYKERPSEENSLVTGQVFPPKAP